MKLCPRCQTENSDDADFCVSCRNYLRWEPTRMVPAAPPSDAPAAPQAPAQAPPREPAAAPPPPPPPPPPPEPAVARAEEVQVTLHGADGAAGGPAAVSMPPGGEGRLTGELRNQSGKVDNYDLRIDGIPSDWYTITPATVYLVPFGARAGDFEKGVEVRFHPPRSAEAMAGSRQISLIATSRASGSDAGAAPAELTITPFHELEAELRPERAGGRRKADFAVAVRNNGNAPLEVEFDGEDEEQACRFRFEQQTVTARPGKRAGTAFTVQPRSQIWVGRAVDRPFQITAEGTEPGAPAATARGVLRQKPWLPWWAPIALALLIVAAIFAYNWWTNRTTAVPSLRGDTLAQARSHLSDAGFQLSTDLPQTKTLLNDPNDWGKVISQQPQGNSQEKHGTVVTVVLGAGPPTAAVPSLCGQTLAQVTAAVQRAGLSLVPPDPTPAATDHSLAKNCQAPAVGQHVAQGSPVKVVFPGAAGSSGGSGSGTASVPASAAAAQQAGFSVQQVPELAPGVAFGQTIYQSPAPGQVVPTGSSITMYVSQPPPVAFDDLTSVFTQSPGKKAAKLVSAGGQSVTEPTLSIDDTRLAYLSRPTAGGAGVVHVVDLTSSPALDQPVTSPSIDAHRPVFAPSPTRHLLAYTVWPASGTGSQLCFDDLDTPATAPCATADTTYDLDRPAWSPDGTQILAVALDPNSETPVGLVQFKTSTPFDATGTDWSETPGLVITGPVQFVAFSPGGKRIALSVGNPPVLQTAQIKNGQVQTPTPVGQAIPAGALAFWADGRLAIAAPSCQATSPISVVNLKAAPVAPVTVLGQTGCNPSYLPQQVYQAGATP